jgi:hypothetical protein
MLLAFSKHVIAQSNVDDLKGKTFLKVGKTPDMDNYEEIYFISKTEVVYIITNKIRGKIYVNKCSGKAIVNRNIISIKCYCDDKDLFPEPIEDKFIYNPKNKKLVSERYSWTGNGDNIIWNIK